jgi:heterodisulfide reductase subunit C
MSQNHNKETDLGSQIVLATGENTACCYQCGKCSAGCPMAEEMKLKPHDFMRLAQFNQADDIFKDPSMWLCLTCETCSARCPNECDPARVIDALREMAMRRKAGNSPREISAFHNSFLDQIRLFGRVFEIGLIAEYKLRSLHFMQDVDSAPGMLMRGKLSFVPQRIKGIDEIRKIFKACEDHGEGEVE